MTHAQLPLPNNKLTSRFILPRASATANCVTIPATSLFAPYER